MALKVMIKGRSNMRKSYQKKRFRRSFVRQLRRACNDAFALNVPMKHFCEKYYSNRNAIKEEDKPIYYSAVGNWLSGKRR